MARLQSHDGQQEYVLSLISGFTQIEPPSDIRFSVVINTDDRLAYLKRTLSGLTYQRYRNFEVCIVCGPTKDGTRDYVASLTPHVKIAYCDERNLSQSRNIGIAMATGDVVAFIDDDAVPEAEWLEELALSYSDSTVGAVGGFVYDYTGVRFQSTFVTVNRLGYPIDWSGPASHLQFPFSQNVPHLLGTNCSFRRSALLEIGGFDEEYEYFLDETDLCCRLNDAGYGIIQRDDAFVHHKFAPSQIRNDKRIVKNWYALIKNRIYFGIRNGLNHHSVEEITAAGIRDIGVWEAAIITGKAKGLYSQNDLDRFYREASDALRDGHARGLERAKYLRAETLAAHESPFRPYRLNAPDKCRRVFCLVTPNYPLMSEDVAVHGFSQLARALADMGHHVHVLTATQEHAFLDFEDGVWVHGMEIRDFAAPPSPLPAHDIPSDAWKYSRTMLEEAMAVDGRRKIDLIYCDSAKAGPLAFQMEADFAMMVAVHDELEGASDGDILAAQKHVLEQADMIHIVGADAARLRSFKINLSNRKTILPSIDKKESQETLFSKVILQKSCFIVKNDGNFHEKYEEMMIDIAQCIS